MDLRIAKSGRRHQSAPLCQPSLNSLDRAPAPKQHLIGRVNLPFLQLPPRSRQHPPQLGKLSFQLGQIDSALNDTNSYEFENNYSAVKDAA